MLGNRKQNLLKPTSLVQMHCSIVFRFCNVFKTRIFTIYDLCWKGFMLIFHLLLFVSLANSFWSDVVETPPFTAHVTDRVKLVSGGQTLGKCCWKYFGFPPPKLPASESHTNESPVLSVLMNFNTDTHRLHFCRYCKARGKELPRCACGRTLIVFYEYISKPREG